MYYFFKLYVFIFYFLFLLKIIKYILSFTRQNRGDFGEERALRIHSWEGKTNGNSGELEGLRAEGRVNRKREGNREREEEDFGVLRFLRERNYRRIEECSAEEAAEEKYFPSTCSASLKS